MKKHIALIAFFIFPLTFIFSEASSASRANLRTALRCLTLAKGYAAEDNWDLVISQAALGLAYDDTLSDLWYITALAKSRQDAPFSETLPLVQKALKEDHWVDYNRDGARLMYADILCDTLEYEKVPAILDTEPRLYSADAEYVRAKAYYRMGDALSVSIARDKIDSARRMYPADTRFPLLFFKNESPVSVSQDVLKLSSYFINQITQYVEASPDKNAELEIYAARFAQGTAKTHLLKSFSARDLRHPLYAIEALKDGLISEKKAFDYMADYSDASISYSVLTEFISMLSEEETIKTATEYFNAYNGIIYTDTDGDGIDNLHVKYERGRPQTVFYDKNQDGIFEWMIVCDFGLPVAGSMTARNMDFTWADFPYLKTVTFKSTSSEKYQNFNLVSETLKWTPVQIELDEILSEKLGIKFFMPYLTEETSEITNTMLIDSSFSFTIPSEERPGAQITFAILEGEVQTAQYSADGKQYAFAEFKNSVPVLRMVDSDGDDVYETTEFYDIDTDGSRETHSLEDERTVMTNLFGLPSNGAAFYLRMVQVDTNCDTVPDFTEEYLEKGGVISTWDNDGDGLWEVRYVLYSKEYNADGSEKARLEDSMFYVQPGRSLITVKSRGGLPFSVSRDGIELTVTKEKSTGKNNFYWLGTPGSQEIAKKAVISLNQSSVQGVCTIIETQNERLYCIKSGNASYGIIIQDESLTEESDENQEN